MNPTVIATIVCLIAAVSEALVTGSDPRSRFRKLRLPSYSPAFRIWILIGSFLSFCGTCSLLWIFLICIDRRWCS
jgi:hypothetical protein